MSTVSWHNNISLDLTDSTAVVSLETITKMELDLINFGFSLFESLGKERPKTYIIKYK